MFYKLLDWIDMNKIEIDWSYLSANPNAIEFLKENPKYIRWSYLSSNPNALELLIQNPDELYNINLCYNQNKEILKRLVVPNLDKADWGQLSLNPSADFILKENQDHINFDCLCVNNSDDAIELLFKNKKKLNIIYYQEIIMIKQLIYY